jgi:nucleoside-diphosphate-sugar epimerase
METIAPHNALAMRFTTVYGPGAREKMLIPKILKNDVDYINVDHSRDFIHIDDLLTAIGTLIINPIPRKPKFVDIGTGTSNNLLDILSHLNMEVKDKRMGTIFERKDNKANIGTLTKMGWLPTINLLDYLKENYDN